MAGATGIDRVQSQPHNEDEKAFRHRNLAMQQETSESADLEKVEALMHQGEDLAKQGNTEGLRRVIENSRPILATLPKAKAAKFIRSIVDLFLNMQPQTQTKKERTDFNDMKVSLCRECITWAKDENRIFLRQTLQARLVRLYNDIEQHQASQSLAQTLIKELKKVDDKDLIVEVQLEESKATYALGNLTKARAALTSARTTGNAIYIPPKMQAALDMQSGILHAAEDRDFKTAYSYFYEAFEGYESIVDGGHKREALRALKYMLLSKIMLDVPEEVFSLLGSGKMALKYADREEIVALKDIADAAKKRSLEQFNTAFGTHREQLQQDAVVKSHFTSLYDAMLEKNLLRIIESYSRVEVRYIASTINLPESKVERKLSQMILDKKLHGILDQGEGVLIVYGDVKTDVTYATALDTIHALGKVVDQLYHKTKALN